MSPPEHFDNEKFVLSQNEKLAVGHGGIVPGKFDDANDEEFGGPEERQRLERKLLWKLDLRMSIVRHFNNLK
jgi:hypothetical protein